MLTQSAYESLAAIQAMLRDPEHEARVKEWDKTMGEVGASGSRTVKAPYCLPTLRKQVHCTAKHRKHERTTA